MTNMTNCLTTLLSQPSKFQFVLVACAGLVGLLQGVLSTNAKDEERYESSLQFWLLSRQRQLFSSLGALLIVFALYKLLTMES